MWGSLITFVCFIIIFIGCIYAESAGDSLSIVNDSFSHASISFVSSAYFITLSPAEAVHDLLRWVTFPLTGVPSNCS